MLARTGEAHSHVVLGDPLQLGDLGDGQVFGVKQGHIAERWGQRMNRRREALAVIGVLGTAGHVALAGAYRHADASRVGAIEYTAFVWDGALGFVFFAEVPSAATFAGAALIIAGALVVVRDRKAPTNG